MPRKAEPPTLRTRSSGVLLHVTSLPGGRLGAEARRFVDWLAAAGQRWWQVLPVGPPDEEGSPYRAASAFAGWSGLLERPEARVTAREIDTFVASHGSWVGDWAAYAGAGAVADQVRFAREWSALRAYGRARGVGLIGDLPIYVASGSADHRSRPELFQKGLVAGVPPDDWSATGQLWGNPIYDWALMRRTGFRWWIERIRRTMELFDVTRIDHFRGLVAYWAVPAGARTAEHGAWRRAPGRELLAALRRELGPLPLVAEDLGVITPPVEELRDRFELPGMTVLQFAFAEGMRNPQALDPVDHRVVYTGTHDNHTTVAWWADASEQEQRNVLEAAMAAGIEPDADDPAGLLVRLALRSRARTALLPAQDILRLGDEARMNVPGEARWNWSWRLEPGQLTAKLAAWVRAETVAAGRAVRPVSPRARAGGGRAREAGRAARPPTRRAG